MDLKGAIDPLRLSRPIFHSEADFQHSLAWELHQLCPSRDIRLECPIGKVHVDIVLRGGTELMGIELKYKTRGLSAMASGEEFRLTNHGAQDCGRYDFFLDVERMERFVAGSGAAVGYVLFLTNDSSYWLGQRRGTTVCDDFRTTEGRRVTGSLAWGPGAGPGTTKGRRRRLITRGNYVLHWRDYSVVNSVPDGKGRSSPYNKFRYLLVGVNGGGRTGVEGWRDDGCG